MKRRTIISLSGGYLLVCGMVIDMAAQYRGAGIIGHVILFSGLLVVASTLSELVRSTLGPLGRRDIDVTVSKWKWVVVVLLLAVGTAGLAGTLMRYYWTAVIPLELLLFAPALALAATVIFVATRHLSLAKDV